MFKQTIKNFNINLNSSNERGIVSGGEPLTGQIMFELTKETKITSITMALKGKASVHWSSGGGGRRGRSRRNFSAKVEYFNLNGVILPENRATSSSVPESRTSTLQPGTHVYPFSCQIPQGDFPSTYQGIHGEIKYTLTVGINRPWHMSKDFVTELKFVNHINTNQPELWAPLSGSNTMTVCCLWCASGPVTVTARTEKKAFVPGETVKLICEFINGSTRTATPKVKLLQKQVFYTHNKVNKKEVHKTLVAVTGEPVCAETSYMQTEIMIAIPSTALLSISNCSIIDVHYLIEMSLCIVGSPDLTVLFPIILYDPPSNTYPPHNL